MKAASALPELPADFDKVKIDDLQYTVDDIVATLRETEERLNKIRGVKGGNPAGPVRQDALLNGSPDDVAKLSAEHEHLSIVRDQLAARQVIGKRELQRRKDQAAIESLPALYKTLGKKVNKIVEARNALADAIAETDKTIQDAAMARQVAGRLYAKTEPAPRSLLQQINGIVGCKGVAPTSKLFPHNQHHMIKDILGLDD